MSIWNKIITAVRGAATEAGEAVVDSQALRILDQEMRDSREALDEAKNNLTSVMAEKMGVERKVKDLQTHITEHEGYVEQALERADESLAMEIAEKIADFNAELAPQEEMLQSYTDNVNQLKQTIKETERNITAMQREVSMVKSTAAVQKANEAVADKFSGSDGSMRSATDSLQRIKDRQQKKGDKMKAAAELNQTGSGKELKDKLKAAGIVQGNASANAILERLKNKNAPKSDA
ncbi:MAG: PspA/IM30 family protein [Mariprofundaceae bacterium]|nr:PspA/IM30 family protein [Mariprofundaceae bacterium]